MILEIKRKLMERSRQQKLDQFLEFYTGGITLDVGVSSNEWTDSINFFTKFINTSGMTRKYIGLAVQDMKEIASRYPDLFFVKYDGVNFPFPDLVFDWVFSNAVIEHVGSRKEQLFFLREMLRVGRNVFFTTPNRSFPIELHSGVPLLHLFLSKSRFDEFLVRIGKAYVTGNYMNLLSKNELLSLLGDATGNLPVNCKVINNRVLGFTCTFSVIISR